MQLLAKLVNPSGGRWIAFYAVVLLAWIVLFLMTYGSQQAELTRIYGADFWRSLCAVDAKGAGYVPTFTMWVLMSGAMMAPTFLPALRVFDDLTRSKPKATTSFGLLLFGYMSIWIGFSAIAAGIQIALNQAEMLQSGSLVSNSASAGLLILAGAYQFSALKNACLTQCREPFSFFMQHWSAGPLRNGVRLGLVCLGCCWTLMLLGFVGGVMSLLWMGGATVLMTLEKLPDIGNKITRPLGLVLIASGAGLFLTSI